jgi:hypothetical protein
MNAHSLLFLAISLAFSPSIHAGGLTTNPQLNQLLGEVPRMGEQVKQDEQALMQKDHQLRSACWNGNQSACQALNDFLGNPNMDPAGRWVNPPPGAYWPFERSVTSDSTTNQLLEQAGQEEQESRQWINDVGNPAVQRELQYDQTLQSNCNNGDTEACQELTNRYNRRSERAEQLQQQWDNHYNQDWVRSFGR